MDFRETRQTTKSKLLPIHVYFKENSKKFLIETSLNGLKYIGGVNRPRWERFYYFISFSMVFTAGLYMAIYFLQKWQSTPVLIMMSPRTTSIQEIPFPGVIFCNMNQALASKVTDIKRGSPDYAILQRVCFQEYNYSEFRNFTPRTNEDNLVNFMLKVSQSCRDMIIYCKYGPNEETCSDLFREIAIDEGICCVFNHMHPYYIYKGKYNYIHDYTSSNGRTSIPVKWNLDKGYSIKLPKRYYPRKAAGSGVSMGLTVVLNADIDEYYCSSTNGEGFKVLLYNPIDRPQIKDTGLPIMLGQQTRLRINSKLMQAEPSLRHINVKYRQCYFSDEKKLLYFKFYTRRNCETECDALQMFRRCNCILYYMPKIFPNVSICYLHDGECVMHTENLLFDPEKAKCREECLSSCQDLVFYPDMFISPLASRDYNLQDLYFRNKSRELMQKNLAFVQIYYKDTFFRGNTKVPYTGLTDFLSQTGGVMSLMVGFGVISIAEIFFFILLKPFVDMFLRRNPKLLSFKDDDQKKKVHFTNSSQDKFHPQMLFRRRRNINNRVMKFNWNELQKFRNEKY